ncbi:hypothetical protein A3G55_00510 [Candidatus Giovannonibacteria bacterium RIFCSPLOWO2_12_FULL_44_25]|uniref:Sugar 3,4-ketoisomerase QdtA cupin domain-containing protein n=3 Tax=Parcubacteria group TaxID=1794811 RepID=A0A837IGF0_9BACT|nr:MAG: hypothetical protein UW15_C0011G0003 [Parcubacteria group bacterium GW2011_GWC1_44_10]KKT60416.1 MAG: hypothetical protein UW53_C0001G0066 [Candidatus Giovannonibacteria bacterium GW2011_GWA1_44_25]KKU12192.1 MAG: hypothetical protein UX18_C0028G0005 [Candidatus Azambacteria bacterium GW2011_GWC2_45_7b]KKU30274.1 MAG: hypothetical protein UX43_C0001G0046 [Candidatus Giovannonibacteria bacterium GW2011_GWB1_46_20]OGF50481.1 MAG: hypothetical protein A2120_02445 [Candidatus Giovannonibact
MITGVLKLVNEDTRRTINEFNSTEGDFSVQQLDIKVSELPLGRHAHALKTETWVIEKGEGSALVAKVDKNGKLVEKPRKIDLLDGSILHLSQFEGHTLYFIPGSQAIHFSSKPFDYKKPDFVPCPELVKENFPELFE